MVLLIVIDIAPLRGGFEEVIRAISVLLFKFDG